MQLALSGPLNLSFAFLLPKSPIQANFQSYASTFSRNLEFFTTYDFVEAENIDTKYLPGQWGDIARILVSQTSAGGLGTARKRWVTATNGVPGPCYNGVPTVTKTGLSMRVFRGT